jgi:hypothetical protein
MLKTISSSYKRSLHTFDYSHQCTKPMTSSIALFTIDYAEEQQRTTLAIVPEEYILIKFAGNESIRSAFYCIPHSPVNSSPDVSAVRSSLPAVKILVAFSQTAQNSMFKRLANLKPVEGIDG